MILGIFILIVSVGLAFYAMNNHRYDAILCEITCALFALGFFLICWDTVIASLR